MKVKNKTKRYFVATIFFIFGLGILCEPVVAAGTEVDIYVKFEKFTWEEYDDGGSQLLEESGPIYTFGASVKTDIAKSVTLKAKGELFSGSIDYDGQTWAGTPVKTDTDYSGFKIEGDIGKNFIVAKKASLEPFAGLGCRSWVRDIKSTSTATGYEETWSVFYARVGIRGDHVYSDRLKIFAEAGLKFPIYNENSIESSVTLEPGKEVSFFAEAGLRWKNFKSSFFYEGMRFSKSDLEPVSSTLTVYQPESKADIYGVSLGIAF